MTVEVLKGKNSTSDRQKLSWLRKITSSKLVAAFNITALPVGLAGIGFSIWSAQATAGNAEAMINLIAGGAIIFGIAAVCSLAFLSWQVVQVQRDLVSVQGKNAVLKLIEEQAGARAYEVAVHFNTLSQAIMDHDHQVVRYIQCAKETAQQQDEDWEELLSCWEQVLLAFCDTAANVLPIQRGLPALENGIGICSANIKLFYRFTGSSLYYRVRRRSRFGNPRRAADDKRPPRLVIKNLMYNEMLQKDRENARLNKPRELFRIPDMEKYLSRFREPSLRRLFDEPTPSALEFYKSCIICPIGDDPYVGIFCVDSIRPDFFNEHYDRLIVTQLINQLILCSKRQIEAEDVRRPLSPPP